VITLLYVAPPDSRDFRSGRSRLHAERAERFPFTVIARDPQEALERAIKENAVPERDRWRISVGAKPKGVRLEAICLSSAAQTDLA
jgi:hypothetical protein